MPWRLGTLLVTAGFVAAGFVFLRDVREPALDVPLPTEPTAAAPMRLDAPPGSEVAHTLPPIQYIGYRLTAEAPQATLNIRMSENDWQTAVFHTGDPVFGDWSITHIGPESVTLISGRQEQKVPMESGLSVQNEDMAPLPYHLHQSQYRRLMDQLEHAALTYQLESPATPVRVEDLGFSEAELEQYDLSSDAQILTINDLPAEALFSGFIGSHIAGGEIRMELVDGEQRRTVVWRRVVL